MTEHKIYKSAGATDALTQTEDNVSKPKARGTCTREICGERTSSGLEISEKSHGLSNYNHAEQVISSPLPNQCQFVFSFDLAKSWSHSVSLLEKLSSGLGFWTG